MRYFRFHGNTDPDNIYEYLGIMDDHFIGLPVRPFRPLDKGKPKKFGFYEVVFLDESDDRVKYFKSVNDYIKSEE